MPSQATSYWRKRYTQVYLKCQNPASKSGFQFYGDIFIGGWEREEITKESKDAHRKENCKFGICSIPCYTDELKDTTMKLWMLAGLILTSCFLSSENPPGEKALPFPEPGAKYRWFNLNRNFDPLKKEYGDYWYEIQIKEGGQNSYGLTFKEILVDTQFAPRSYKLNSVTGKIYDDSTVDFYPLMRINDFPNGYLSVPKDGEISLPIPAMPVDQIRVGYKRDFEMLGTKFDSVVVMVRPPIESGSNVFVYVFEPNLRRLLQEYTVSSDGSIVQGWEVQNEKQ